MDFDELSNREIGCAIEVHRFLAPGLLESAYEQCLAYELNRGGIAFQLQHPQLVQYKEIRLDCGFRIDMLVENQLKTARPVVSMHRYLANAEQASPAELSTTG